jgi:hypothetical protein
MKFKILKVAFLLLSVNGFSQKIQNDTLIDTEKLSTNQIENIGKIASQRGWVMLKSKDGNTVINFSNKDYLILWSNCKKPKMLIEYTQHYRDGEYAGVDFDETDKNNYAKIDYVIDSKNYNNPFKNYEAIKFNFFFSALKTAKVLTIKYYDKELNAETGKNELKLNRSIDFKLANGAFLDEKTVCN